MENNELKATIKEVLMEVLGDMGGRLLTVRREAEDDDPLMRFSDTLNAKPKASGSLRNATAEDLGKLGMSDSDKQQSVFDQYNGSNAKELAQTFGKSEQWVYRVVKRLHSRSVDAGLKRWIESRLAAAQTPVMPVDCEADQLSSHLAWLQDCLGKLEHPVIVILPAKQPEQ